MMLLWEYALVTTTVHAGRIDSEAGVSGKQFD
jgi:hypothetical protein